MFDAFTPWREAWRKPEPSVFSLAWTLVAFFAGFSIAFVLLRRAAQDLSLNDMVGIQSVAVPAFAAGLALFLLARWTLYRPMKPVLSAPGRPFGVLTMIVSGLIMAGLNLGLWTLMEDLGAGPVQSLVINGNPIIHVSAALLGFGFAALVEEIVFRGHLLPALAARFSITAGVCLSAVIFTALHFRGTVETFAATLLLGLVLALATARTGSIAAALGGHIGYNLILVYRGPDFEENAAALNLAALTTIYGLWLVAIWFAPTRRQPPLNAAETPP